MKTRIDTVTRDAARRAKNTLIRAMLAIDEYASNAHVSYDDIDLSEFRDARDQSSDDSRAFFHDIEQAHAHSRKVAY